VRNIFFPFIQYSLPKPNTIYCFISKRAAGLHSNHKSLPYSKKILDLVTQVSSLYNADLGTAILAFFEENFESGPVNSKTQLFERLFRFFSHSLRGGIQ
jgi:hypothetical protein